MNKGDWNNLGGDLNRIIEDAIYNGRYSRLSSKIRDEIKSTFGISDFSSGSIPQWDFNLSGQKTESGQKTDVGQKTESGHKKEYDVKHEMVNLYMGKKGRKSGTLIMLVGGIVLATIVAPFFLYGLMAVLSAKMAGVITALFISAVPLVTGIVLIAKSTKTHNLSKRFDRYLKEIGHDEYADIKKLSTCFNMTEKNTLKDVKTMIAKGWFIQGRLDRNETCLITSDRAYGQYMEAYNNSKMQEAQRRKAEAEKTRRRNGLSPEIKDILDRGSKYIEAIRTSNEAICGEVVSKKIDRIEDVVQRIFKHTEAHPENAADLRRFMDYYLPMTIKLLKAYEEMDSHLIQGENILNSKREIEETLDTLNVAFEKIFDDLFEETAWDVSSDISVLNTILAQEGLTEDGLINS